MVIELNPEQVEFLITVLNTIQISGTAEQVRRTLAIIYTLAAKLEPSLYDQVIEAARKETK